MCGYYIVSQCTPQDVWQECVSCLFKTSPHFTFVSDNGKRLAPFSVKSCRIYTHFLDQISLKIIIHLGHTYLSSL